MLIETSFSAELSNGKRTFDEIVMRKNCTHISGVVALGIQSRLTKSAIHEDEHRETGSDNLRTKVQKIHKEVDSEEIPGQKNPKGLRNYYSPILKAGPCSWPAILHNQTVD